MNKNSSQVHRSHNEKGKVRDSEAYHRRFAEKDIWGVQKYVAASTLDVNTIVHSLTYLEQQFPK